MAFDSTPPHRNQQSLWSFEDGVRARIWLWAGMNTKKAPLAQGFCASGAKVSPCRAHYLRGGEKRGKWATEMRYARLDLKNSSCGPSRLCGTVHTVHSPRTACRRADQNTVRAKPCAGKAAFSSCGPNQGQQIGTPPRTDLPDAKLASADNQITSASPLSIQLSTCVPCTLITALAC